MIGWLIVLYALWCAWRDRNRQMIEVRVVGNGEWTYRPRPSALACSQYGPAYYFADGAMYPVSANRTPDVWTVSLNPERRA